jgi:hypothetical protein
MCQPRGCSSAVRRVSSAVRLPLPDRAVSGAGAMRSGDRGVDTDIQCDQSICVRLGACNAVTIRAHVPSRCHPNVGRAAADRVAWAFVFNGPGKR